MIINQVYPTQTGVDASIWKVLSISLDTNLKKLNIHVFGFFDEESMLLDRQPLEMKYLVIDVSDEDYTTVSNIVTTYIGKSLDNDIQK